MSDQDRPRRPLPPAAERPPVLASLRYHERAADLTGRLQDEIFTYIHRTNLWGSSESTSGEGSELGATAVLRAEIPALLRRLGVKVMLDAPCGDFGWMRHVDLSTLDRYIGADIVADIVDRNNARYADEHRRFELLDLSRDRLPRADLVLCRDCLVHLTYDQIRRVLANIKASGAEYVLMTTFVEIDTNADAATGDWRPLNFQLPPFCLPEPLCVIVEGCTEAGGAYADKTLGLWRAADLPVA
ncbi:class I SAM-dependent methyltransferase [Plantactinospora sp. CA-294935]|uniref:class I SAM-dependent methyltransferase n=1 Tax=Plantactinospora sp. CA-294935 TaxID=3240012 RepID=UPI003D944F28